MSHGDWCCAVCDRRILLETRYFLYKEAAKRLICARCAINLYKVSGREITTPKELTAPVDEVRRVLAEVEFETCRTENEVDEALWNRLGPKGLYVFGSPDQDIAREEGIMGPGLRLRAKPKGLRVRVKPPGVKW